MAKAGTKLPDGSAFFTATVPTFHGKKAGRKSRSSESQTSPLIVMLKIVTKPATKRNGEKFVVEVLAQGHCAEPAS